VTAQFQEIVETTCGQDLDWFFQEWIYDVGWPEYRYAWVGQQSGADHRLLLASTRHRQTARPLSCRLTSRSPRLQATPCSHSGSTRPTNTMICLSRRADGGRDRPDNWILNRATEAPAAGIEEPPLGQDPLGHGVADAGGSALPLRICPNPFSAETRIEFSVPHEGAVRAQIFDPAGRLVRTLMEERRAAGPIELRWDGRDESGQEAPSGAYFLRLAEGERLIAVQRGLLLR